MTPDSNYNHFMAKKIAGGDLLAGDRPFYRAPLYLYFLAVFYAVFGPSPFFPKLAQVILGGLNPLLLFWIGRKLFSQRVGLLAAVVGGLYGNFVFYEAILLKTGLSVFLILSSMGLLLTAVERNRWLYWLGGGGLIGLSALLRPNLLLYIPLAMASIIWVGKRDGLRNTVRRAFMFGLGALILIIPVTLRNLYMGDLVLINTVGGFSFYIGNNPVARPTYRKVPGISGTFFGEPEDIQRVAEEVTGRKLRPSEASTFWLKKGLSFIYHNPISFLKLFAGKLFLSVNQLEVPDTENLYLAQRFSTVLNLPLPSFGLILPLGLVGAFIGRRQQSGRIFLDFFILTVFFTLAMFYVTARYRLSMVPFLIIYASHTIVWAIDRLRAKEYCPLLLALVATAILMAVSGTERYPDLKRNFSHYYKNAGIYYQFMGKTDRAIPELERALQGATKTTQIQVFEFLGVCYAEKGQPEKALSYLNKALALKPSKPASIYYRRALVYYLIFGDLERAEKDILQAIQLQPHLARAYGYLGVIRREQGRMKEALQHLLRAKDLQPEWTIVYLELARCYEIMGERLKADKVLREGLRQDPDNQAILAFLERMGDHSLKE